MIYFRCSLSHHEVVPSELSDWEPPHPGVALNTVTHGEHRIVGVCGQWDMGIPDGPWEPHSAGWEACKVREPNLDDLVRLNSKWQCHTVACDGRDWFLPAVWKHDGKRAFKVSYGGPDFLPKLTPEQERIEAIAAAIKGDDGSDMSLRARWAAALISLTYSLSPQTISMCDFLSEDLIDHTLCAAIGYGKAS